MVEDVGKKIKEKYGNDKQCVVGFSGDLGSGKTTIVKFFASFFGCKEVVKSPTFCFMSEYSLPKPPFETLVHIDAYRCETEQDVITTGIRDACKQKKCTGVC